MTARRVVRVTDLALAVCIAGCSTAADAPAARTTIVATAPVPLRLSAPRDTGATLLELAQFVAAVDRDTANMDVETRPIEIGAGARGTLRAWRAGSAWQRVQVDAGGAGFHTTDTWWLHGGRCVAARLESVRPGERPAVEQVWFRDSTLYRWTDAEGRTLSRDARSTRHEVDNVLSRLDRAMQQLDAPRPVNGG